MDEKAKVRAHAVLDSSAGSDEPLETVAPGFVLPIEIGFRQATSVAMFVVVVDVVVGVGRPCGVVGQENANDAVATTLEAVELAGVTKVVAHEFWTGQQGGLKPNATVVAKGVLVGLNLRVGGGHAGSAGVVVGREESVNPQLVMDFSAPLSGNGVHAAVAAHVGRAVEEGGALDGSPHGVEQVVCVANQFLVLVNVDVEAECPETDGLHQFGGLIAVKSSDKGGLLELAEVSDEDAFLGFLADFEFIKTKAELTTEALCSALQGACIFIKGGCTLGEGGFFVFVFRDVDDQLAFVVSDIGCTLGDLGASVAAVFSSSCVNFCSFFIVECCHLFSPGTIPNPVTIYKELKRTHLNRVFAENSSQSASSFRSMAEQWGNYAPQDIVSSWRS